MKANRPSLFSFHLGGLVLRFLKQKNNRPLIKTSIATPPMTPPTILPMFASPMLGSVRAPLLSELSGAIMPADPPDGREVATEVVCCGCSATVVSIDDGDGSLFV